MSGVKEDKCLCRSAAFKSLGSNLPIFLDARLAIAGYCGALETVDFNTLSLHECYEKGGMCLAISRQLSWELQYYNITQTLCNAECSNETWFSEDESY